MKIGILNYGLGNIGSVESALQFLKLSPIVVSEPAQIKQLDALVVAGVGHYSHSMKILTEGALNDSFRDFALTRRKPVLGICLGMQLFSTTSEEGDSEVAGLGWIPGKVVKLTGHEKIPHIGWVHLTDTRGNLHGKANSGPFYFMHSYHFVVADPAHITSWAHHGEQKFVASVQKDNLFGVQFHPEKSQGDGIRLLNDFARAAREF
jgi:glutamine amidotransferase